MGAGESKYKEKNKIERDLTPEVFKPNHWWYWVALI